MRSHIDSLNKKDYERLENIRSLDFVFIFIPIEAAFMLALEHEPGLFKYAYDKHIILVSPTTLLATLRTVESIWRYEKQNRNAEKIAAMAGGLHDQFALLIEAFKEVGQNIDKTQKSYELVQNRLQHGRGNLIKRVRDLEILGAKTKKSLSIEYDSDLEDIDLESDDLENSEAGSIDSKETGNDKNLLEAELEN
jgi:DNA recombination protein RmuC